MRRPPNGGCDRMPRGWYCSLGPGHWGPCPAWPKGWRRLYWWWRLQRA